MAIRDWSAYQRALRAAAGVTGVLRRHGAAIAAAAALTTASGCSVHGGQGGGEPPRATAASSAKIGDGPMAPRDRADLTETERMELEALGDCTDSDGKMMGYSSPCCERYREITGEQFGPFGCTPWGPPAPPAYDGARLA